MNTNIKYFCSRLSLIYKIKRYVRHTEKRHCKKTKQIKTNKRHHYLEHSVLYECRENLSPKTDALRKKSDISDLINFEF